MKNPWPKPIKMLIQDPVVPSKLHQDVCHRLIGQNSLFLLQHLLLVWTASQTSTGFRTWCWIHFWVWKPSTDRLFSTLPVCANGSSVLVPEVSGPVTLSSGTSGHRKWLHILTDGQCEVTVRSLWGQCEVIRKKNIQSLCLSVNACLCLCGSEMKWWILHGVTLPSPYDRGSSRAMVQSGLTSGALIIFPKRFCSSAPVITA